MARRLTLNLCTMTAIMFVSVGCLPPPPPQPIFKELPTPFLKHRVKGGETLSLLASWYTGDEQKWSDLFVRASSTRLSGLREGDEILIPREIAINEGLPPDDFVAKFRARVPRKSNGLSSKRLDQDDRAMSQDGPIDSQDSVDDFDPAKELMNEFLKNEKAGN